MLGEILRKARISRAESSRAQLKFQCVRIHRLEGLPDWLGSAIQFVTLKIARASAHVVGGSLSRDCMDSNICACRLSVDERLLHPRSTSMPAGLTLTKKAVVSKPTSCEKAGHMCPRANLTSGCTIRLLLRKCVSYSSRIGRKKHLTRHCRQNRIRGYYRR